MPSAARMKFSSVGVICRDRSHEVLLAGLDLAIFVDKLSDIISVRVKNLLWGERHQQRLHALLPSEGSQIHLKADGGALGEVNAFTASNA